MKTLVIVPAFNEESSLPGLLAEFKNNYPQYDVLVINDCSTDNTRSVCESHNVAAVHLPVNLGIGGAVQSGYKYAYYNNYDAAVQVDGDGQHNPGFISDLIAEINSGCNLCIGSRFITKEGFQSSAARRTGIWFLSKLIKLFTKETVTDPTSGFRACDRKAIELFALDYPKDYPEPETIVSASKQGLKISEVPVLMNERVGGKSSISSLKSLYYMIKVSLAIMVAAFKSVEKGRLNT